MRQGRKVRGPGSETSDSIPAMLSNNEFVIKAKSAKKIGYDTLHHMNRTGEIPMAKRMVMKKSNRKQASDMAGYKKGGKIRMQGGGLLSIDERRMREQEDRISRGESPNAQTPPPTPPVQEKPQPQPYTAKPPSGMENVSDAELEARMKKPWYKRMFGMAKGGAVCAACGGKMSAGGKCMKCGGMAKKGLSGYAGGGKAHPGFKAVAAKIGRNPKIRNPNAVLAAATRRASPAAKRANPRLKRVSGA